MTETFICKLQAKNRVAIPVAYVETMKLKQGDKVRVSIEKVR